MTPRPRRLLTVAEAAAYLNTSRRHIYQLIHERAFPVQKLGLGRKAPVRIDADVLDVWLDACTIDARNAS